jgi:hypothetical protein
MVLWIHNFIVKTDFLHLSVLSNKNSEFHKVFLINFSILEVLGSETCIDRSGLILELLIFKVVRLLKIKRIVFIFFKDSKTNPFKVLYLSDNITKIKQIVDLAFKLFPFLAKLPVWLAPERTQKLVDSVYGNLEIGDRSW